MQGPIEKEKTVFCAEDIKIYMRAAHSQLSPSWNIFLLPFKEPIIILVIYIHVRYGCPLYVFLDCAHTHTHTKTVYIIIHVELLVGGYVSGFFFSTTCVQNFSTNSFIWAYYFSQTEKN